MATAQADADVAKQAAERGLRLTPTRAAELILAVAPRNEWFGRRDIIPKVVDEHRRRGGIATGSYVSTVKKALQTLRQQERIEFNGQKSVAAQYMIPSGEYSQSVDPFDSAAAPEAIVNEESSATTADEIVGSSRESHGYIYVICQVDRSGVLDGMVKIGMSGTPNNQRAVQQVRDGAPGTRRIGLMYYVKESSMYEKVLHLLLTANGRRITGAGGSEWFRSSPNEVKRLITILENLVPEIPSDAFQLPVSE